MKGFTTILPVLLALARPTVPATGADGMNGPWEASREVVGRTSRAETRPEVVTAAGALRLFQKLVSPVDGPRCNLYPTCSEFARQAVRQHGLLVGAMLAAGRLLRDNSSAPGFYPEAVVNGRLVLYDPLDDHWPRQRRESPEVTDPSRASLPGGTKIR